MAQDFWDQVQQDAASILGGSEVALPVLIVDGETVIETSGIFEHSYREIEGEGLIPIPSKYLVVRVCEKDLPIQIREGMQVVIGEKAYEVAGIREPGLSGITTVELRP